MTAMNQGVATPYPWQAVERVSRVAAQRGARARRAARAVLDVQRVSRALSELTETEASVIINDVSTKPPRRRPLTELGFEIGSSALLCAVSVEPELAARTLSHVLRRSITLTAHAALDDTLSGALSALVLELARRCGAKQPLHLLAASDVLARAADLFVEATVLLDGVPYAVVVALQLPELPIESGPSLTALGELPIAVPLVVGWSLAERAALREFVPGNAWLPGSGLWIDQSGSGKIALAAPGREAGISGELSRDGKIVLRGESVPLFADAGEMMADSAKSETSLTDAVLDSPLVVRVEMGAVSLTAREWAELGPGDVIETGRRIAEPVVLRIAGREVARGELVNIEGELGVRIRELVQP